MYKYDFHLRDYRSKTGHLDYLHHAAYRQLLDAYYDSERPLPGNPGLCHRLAGAFSDDEREAVNAVLKEFFVLAADGLFHNKMADEQIAKYMQFVVSQRENGKKGGRPSKPNGIPNGLDSANPKPNPNESLSPSPSPTKKRTTFVRKAVAYSDEFMVWWNRYPRKESKAKAWEAWERIAPPKPFIDELLAAIEWQSKSDKWVKDGGQYVPMPTTYLNGRKWEDKPMSMEAAPYVPKLSI